jgi:4-hydroxy-3-polyprenylbenzoate decarboxylase
MAYPSMREWVQKLDDLGLIQHITTEVDWDLELGAIARRVLYEGGPALLFENIKDHKDTPCKTLFINGMGTQERVAIGVGLPRDTTWRGIVEFIKGKLVNRVPPVIVSTGPVKENIIKGDDINVYEFPAPKYNHLDPGRYCDTFAGTVTIDPDTKVMNIGMYRGMQGENKRSIVKFLNRSQHWGIHFSKYQKRNQEMPVAVVYGWDPALMMMAATPIIHPDFSEYDMMGSLRGEPVPLVKCETHDLYVPASAEIVIEGFISPNPETFQMEGPFGEFPGFHGGTRQLRPVIRVECITHRNNPIYQAGLEGSSPGKISESAFWATPPRAAGIWQSLEDVGVPNIKGVWGPIICQMVNLRIQIDTLYRGHSKQVAAAFWALGASAETGKNLVVVDNDVDIFDDQAVEWATAFRCNAELDGVQFFRGTIGSSLDPSVPLAERDPMKYGQGKWTRVFTDATVNWDLPPEDRYSGRREPPLCTGIDPDTDKLICSRWSEYGFKK